MRDTSRVTTTRLPETCMGYRGGAGAPRPPGSRPHPLGCRVVGLAQASSDRLVPGPGMGKEDQVGAEPSAPLPSPGPAPPLGGTSPPGLGVGFAMDPGPSKETQDLVVGELLQVGLLAKDRPGGTLGNLGGCEAHLHEANASEGQDTAGGSALNGQHPLAAIGGIPKRSPLRLGPAPGFGCALHHHPGWSGSRPRIPCCRIVFLPPARGTGFLHRMLAHP